MHDVERSRLALLPEPGETAPQRRHLSNVTGEEQDDEYCDAGGPPPTASIVVVQGRVRLTRGGVDRWPDATVSSSNLIVWVAAADDPSEAELAGDGVARLRSGAHPIQAPRCKRYLREPLVVAELLQPLQVFVDACVGEAPCVGQAEQVRREAERERQVCLVICAVAKMGDGLAARV